MLTFSPSDSLGQGSGRGPAWSCGSKPVISEGRGKFTPNSHFLPPSLEIIHMQWPLVNWKMTAEMVKDSGHSDTEVSGTMTQPPREPGVRPRRRLLGTRPSVAFLRSTNPNPTLQPAHLKSPRDRAGDEGHAIAFRTGREQPDGSATPRWVTAVVQGRKSNSECLQNAWLPPQKKRRKAT